LELNIPIEHRAKAAALFGATDINLRRIRDAFDVRLAARDGEIHLSGSSDGVRRSALAIEILQRRLRETDQLEIEDVDRAIEESSREDGSLGRRGIDVYTSGMKIKPRTDGQSKYVDAMLANDLTFCLGPAGSGKTYLAVAVALSLLKKKQIDRLILTRPAVEAGEKLGYLPGDIQAKVNPYLRPLFDALNDMVGVEQIRRFMDNDIIEVSPLAFMRGRTLNKSVIILDEAQNTTAAQMQMFLTRLGHNSKMVVTGDDSQSDLAPGQRSGVLDAEKRLGNVKGIAIVRLTEVDIVRHPLVLRIVEAYDASGTHGR
jgi:phosphate starvation-inducible protein PhoH and related proteins